MTRIAIITARGGSKRIPGKNIREFCGKPIIAYSIEAAIDSGLYDEIMVSTDSDDIAKVAQKYGASVPFKRSQRTSDDFATTRDVLLEVLAKYEEMGKKFDEMVCIYPTAPFITGKKMREALSLMEEKNGAMVLPMVKFSYPPQRAYIISEGIAYQKWEKFQDTRSQDLESMYHDAGQFYCYNIAAYMECSGRIQEKIVPYILPESEVQDIDTLDDWKLAEIKYRCMRKAVE